MSRIVKIPAEQQDEHLQIYGMFSLDPSWTVTVQTSSEAVGSVTLSVVFDEVLKRFAGSSLTVERAGEGSDITGNVLRDFRMAEVLQMAALEHIFVDSKVSGISSAFRLRRNGVDYVAASTVLKKLTPVSGRTTDNDAAKATIAYRIAQLSGMPVLKTISDALETSQSTAKRLVARARELGYLDG